MLRAFIRAATVVAVAACAVPAAAGAAASWGCGATAGWLAANGQRAEAPALGGTPCPAAKADATGAAGAPGSLGASGALVAEGGAASQTVDTRTPRASVSAKSLTIQSADGLVLTSSDLSSRAAGACDADRRPVFSSEGSPGSVTLNGRAIDTGREYSEPGVGVNGAPLFGKITVRFDELERSDAGLTRRAIHLVVTDRNGAVVFEAVAGEARIARDGLVCEPPPVCPPGQEPQAGGCVDVSITPLPQAPSPVAPVPGAGPTPAPGAPTTRGCAGADAQAGQVSTRRLARATLCVLNLVRAKRGLRRFRMNAALARAAGRHVRDMVGRRYFSHTQPSGARVIDRILRSGYLRRYGRWRVGENLGWGWGAGASPRAIVAAWMRSRPHRANILNRRFHDVGIAVKRGSPQQSRRGSITYVIDFGGFLATRARG